MNKSFAEMNDWLTFQSHVGILCNFYKSLKARRLHTSKTTLIMMVTVPTYPITDIYFSFNRKKKSTKELKKDNEN